MEKHFHIDIDIVFVIVIAIVFVIIVVVVIVVVVDINNMIKIHQQCAILCCSAFRSLRLSCIAWALSLFFSRIA